jgi:hypothetical protein
MSRFDEPIPSGVRWWLQDGVLVVRSGLRFTGQELAQAFADAVESVVLKGPLPVLFDNRHSQERASASEIRDRARRISAVSELFGPRIAVVVSDALHYGLARMGSGYADAAGGPHVEVFETPAEALGWLLQVRHESAAPADRSPPRD